MKSNTLHKLYVFLVAINSISDGLLNIVFCVLTKTNRIYPFVFDFLYQQILEEKPNNSLISASLLCVLNMTKSDFGLARAISESKAIELIKTIIQRS